MMCGDRFYSFFEFTMLLPVLAMAGYRKLGSLHDACTVVAPPIPPSPHVLAPPPFPAVCFLYASCVLSSQHVFQASVRYVCR